MASTKVQVQLDIDFSPLIESLTELLAKVEEMQAERGAAS